jgi:hypothetical protein
MNEWQGRAAASRLRQWPQIVDLAHRVDDSALLSGLFLLGSFARGAADPVSDVDFIVVIENGHFDDAWKRRHDLHPDGVTCWDYPRPNEREVAAHRWLTDDLVLFDGLIATPSGARVADPLVVLVGNPSLPDRFDRREPGVHGGEAVELHEVERLYGQLKLAVRAGRAES